MYSVKSFCQGLNDRDSSRVLKVFLSSTYQCGIMENPDRKSEGGGVFILNQNRCSPWSETLSSFNQNGCSRSTKICIRYEESH